MTDPAARIRRALEEAHAFVGLVFKSGRDYEDTPLTDDLIAFAEAYKRADEIERFMHDRIDVAVREALDVAAAEAEKHAPAPSGAVDTRRIWAFSTAVSISKAIRALRDELFGKERTNAMPDKL